MRPPVDPDRIRRAVEWAEMRMVSEGLVTRGFAKWMAGGAHATETEREVAFAFEVGLSKAAGLMLGEDGTVTLWEEW